MKINETNHSNESGKYVYVGNELPIQKHSYTTLKAEATDLKDLEIKLFTGVGPDIPFSASHPTT